MSDATIMRNAVLALADEDKATIYQRGVEFREDGCELWTYVVVLHEDDADELNALVPEIRDRLESDRGLGNTVIDTRVAKAIGPREHPDGGFFMEWLVQVLT